MFQIGIGLFIVFFLFCISNNFFFLKELLFLFVRIPEESKKNEKLLKALHLVNRNIFLFKDARKYIIFEKSRNF